LWWQTQFKFMVSCVWILSHFVQVKHAMVATRQNGDTQILHPRDWMYMVFPQFATIELLIYHIWTSKSPSEQQQGEKEWIESCLM
jgi:hypothetical protein